jgi:hypothetical protein
MGCTPSESYFASTLECFYDILCINLIQQMTNSYGKSNVSYALDETDSRFTMNMTIIDLVNDLFIKRWLTMINYFSYFDQCSPIVCSYTYIQQFNVIYTVTYLLGLYGGLTIVLKWICPRIVYYVNKIYQRRKKSTNIIQPADNLQMATVENSVDTMNQMNIPNLPTELDLIPPAVPTYPYASFLCFLRKDAMSFVVF